MKEICLDWNECSAHFYQAFSTKEQYGGKGLIVTVKYSKYVLLKAEDDM